MHKIIKEVFILAFVFLVFTVSSYCLISSIDSSKNEENGIVSITFDDGYENVFIKALPLMQYYNYTGTVYFIANWTGKFEYRNPINFEELKDLQDNGWEIGSHTLDHKDLTNLSDKDLDFELSESKKVLNDNRIEADSISFPYGRWTDNVVMKTKKYFSSARTMRRGYNNINEIDNYHLRSYSVKINNSPEEVCSWIENTRPINRWLILNFHYIDENENRPWDESVDDFTEILRCIYESKMRVMNVGEVVKKYGKL